MGQRLIDADALATAIYEWMPKDQETWMESDIPPIENLVVSIMMTIEEQPTIEAIPIEWIIRERNEHKNDGFAWIFEAVLEDWRKEHDTAD